MSMMTTRAPILFLADERALKAELRAIIAAHPGGCTRNQIMAARPDPTEGRLRRPLNTMVGDRAATKTRERTATTERGSAICSWVWRAS